MDQNKEKPSVLKWSHSSGYYIAILAWATGLNTIFNNTKILLQVGLINYLLVHSLIMVLIGIPMTLIELAVSQYSLKSVVRCWDICPFFRGIGYGKMILIVIFQIYYNAMNSYLLLYCFNPIPEYKDYTLFNSHLLNKTFNLTKNNNYRNYLTNSEKFWYKEIVQNDDQLYSTGLINWKLIATLCIHMGLIGMFNIKNLLEKFLLLSFNFSLLEIIILMCVTNTTSGGLDGLKYVIFKNLNLETFFIWKKEGILLEVFQNQLYSLGLALGGFSSIASQSSFRKPLYSISVWTNLANLKTTLVYGFLFANIYGIIQFNTTNKIDDLIKNNSTLDFENIFTVLPNGINYLRGIPQLWSTILYSNIYLKGLCTSSLMIQVVLSVIYEEKHALANHMKLLSFLIFFLITICGCLFHIRFGIEICQFISNITLKVLLPLILTCEIIAVILVYGILRFMNDLHFMLGTYPTVYWPLCLTFSLIIVPLLTSVSVVFYFKYTIMTELNMILLKVMLSVILVWIPFMGMVRIIRKIKFREIFNSSRNWGPPNELVKSRKMFEEQYSIPEFLYEKYLLEIKLKKYE